VLYAALIAFEQRHVSHHIAEIRRPREAPAAPLVVVEAVEAAHPVEAEPAAVAA
jgi:hypothetical protein